MAKLTLENLDQFFPSVPTKVDVPKTGSSMKWFFIVGGIALVFVFIFFIVLNDKDNKQLSDNNKVNVEGKDNSQQGKPFKSVI